MDTYWGKEPGSGRPKMYIPLLMGHLVYRASGPMPQALGTDPAPVFLGYKMVGGTPEFRYRIGARTYREKVVPSPKDGFELRVTPEGAASPTAWKVAPADASAVAVREEKGGLVLSFKDRPEPPQQKAKQPAEAKTQKP